MYGLSLSIFLGLLPPPPPSLFLSLPQSMANLDLNVTIMMCCYYYVDTKHLEMNRVAAKIRAATRSHGP